MNEHDQTAKILLQEFRSFRDVEFREFRKDVSDWKSETGERLAKLEDAVKHGLTGNGEPSRVSVLEAKVEKLTNVYLRVSAVLIAIWGIVTLAAKFLPDVVKKWM